MALLLAPAPNQGVATAPAQALASQSPSPSQTYTQLANEVMALIQRASALPDAKAVALLRHEAPALQARAKPITFAYQRWLKALPPAKLKAEEDRLMNSSFAKQLQTLGAGIRPKMKRSPEFSQLVAGLLQAMTEGL